MKLQYSILLLFFTGGLLAQFYVAPAGSVMVKNTVVFVKQDVNLDGSSRLYLRNEAQLVQGTTSSSTNKGTGLLSVFQEGNATAYTYNQWCAPVGLASASTGNANFGITMLGRPTTITSTTAASITSGYDGAANPLTISDNWIYRYVASTTSSQWIDTGSATTILPGQGFTMKGTSGTDAVIVEGNGVQNNPGSAQRYDFRGKPNDGTISVTVAPGQYTLTGNPYPSALHVNAFLLDATNSACTGIAYYWEQDKTVTSHYLTDYKGGYGTFSPISLVSAGVYVPATFDTYNPDGSVNTTGASSGQTAIQRRYAPIGQGFMIQGAASGTSVSLKNAHRVFFKESSVANSQFYRMVPPSPPGQDSLQIVPLLRINTSFNDQYTRQLALAFPENATAEADRGIDAENADPELPADISFDIDGLSYVIQGIPFAVSLRVPLIVRATEPTSFTVSLLEASYFDPIQPVYLYDGSDGSYHNLKDGPWTVMVPAGVDPDRFELTFEDEALSVPGAEQPSTSLFMDNIKDQLMLHNPGETYIREVILYDVSGRRVAAWNDTGSERTQSFSVSGMSDGVYIVKVTGDAGQTSKKIIIGGK